MMFNQIIKKYFSNFQLFSTVPLEFRVLIPADLHLYLFTYKTDYYVVIEADHSRLASMTAEIEEVFPVIVEGWMVLKESQKTRRLEMLPSDCFSSDTANETDENWNNYRDTFFESDGMKYALLRVHSKSGTTQ